jgi:hypothetical protein
VDPLLAARGFIAMAFYHNLVQELFGGGMYQKFGAEAVSTQLTDIWLQGVMAPEKPNGHARTSKNGRKN